MNGNNSAIDPEVTDPETGEVLEHYEWNGWLWCDVEGAAFDWQTGDVECPHCGAEFSIPEPSSSDEEPLRGQGGGPS